MAADSAKYLFLPWVRQGAASGIQALDMAPDQAGSVSVTFNLSVNSVPQVSRPARLYGPGDVIGISPQQVIRTEPRHQSIDFEPNYFPAIEFDAPDFPWMFTPARADATGKLRPWLCLIVVRKQPGVTLNVDRNAPLPVLDLNQSVELESELPDLAESWAWAHAQVAGSAKTENSLKSSLAGNPALTLSRLLCPRRLDPLTEYLACVVPTFDLGVKAGLGLPIKPEDENALALAWTWVTEPPSPPTVKPSPLRLPVYFHWEFRTGTGGDFETLARLLQPRDAKEMPNVGRRPIAISRPFPITPSLPAGATFVLEGALRVPGATVVTWPEGVQKPFQTELKKILDAPWLATQEEIGNKDPVLAPPIYGCWQAARHSLTITPAPGESITWLDDLNLDPRHRSVAALGTQVVQTQQEELMAAAWEQLGEIQRVNQIRRQAQLARAVNVVYHVKHFNRFSEETLLKIFATGQSRIVIRKTDQSRELLSQMISRSSMPDRAVSAPLRRMASSRGVISTRFRPTGAPPIAIVAKLNTAGLLALVQMAQTGLATTDQPASPAGGAPSQLKQTVRFNRAAQALDTTPPLANFTIVPEGQVRSLLDFQPGPPDSQVAKDFRKAAKTHLEAIGRALGSVQFAPVPAMKFSDTTQALLQSVNPAHTIQTRLQFSLSLASDTVKTADPLEPVMDAPRFPQPMYEALRDLSQDFLLPGLEHVPQNTATLLETNSEFVESYLVGLNAEMSSELLWRDYPTDQRGTYFRQFWDSTADDEPPDATADIKAIHAWGVNRLGKNTLVAGGNLVLLVRGELLRRYPNSVIYAVAAVKKAGKLELSTDPNQEKQPLFRGTLKPDITFLGFDLTRAVAIADPGWFFVIQEQPTEPRFGLDEAKFNEDLPALTDWNNLSWRHMANTEEDLKKLAHVSVKQALPQIAPAKWGKNSSQQAYITLQRPMRIAIHAKQMLP